ncbi:MAG TPA: homoserine kinase [Burkholderiales bacterium]|nr:homoserine kinase [Burkholderiales bacterium]
MSVFTTVTREQLATWLRNYSLGMLTDLHGIAAGIDNTNYFVYTTHGRYVLTLFEKLKAEELPYYLNLMSHLASHGIPCPNPIANLVNSFLGELNGKPACLVSCLQGVDLKQPSPEHCAEVGELLADMHLAGRTYPDKMENPRGTHWWKATAPQIMPFLSQEEADLLKAELSYQSLYRYHDLPRGVIHADLFCDNVLFHNDAVTGVIDFYFACNDVLLYDVAIAVNDWCITQNYELDVRRTRAFLSAYHSTRPFSAAEREAWLVMLRAGALRFWVSRLQDFHLPRPGELTHAKDPNHFMKLLKQHASGQSGLVWL